jgi:dienelactone hydrolase
MPHAAILAFLLFGSPVEVGRARFEPTPLEAQVPELFRLPAAEFSYELEPVRDAGTYTVARLRFPSPITTVDPANNTVHAEYFQPKGPGKRPAVVVLHILGADFALSRYFAARLADQGVAALFVKLPYYGERRADGQDKRFLSTDIERSTLSMRQGVCDIRRASAWLAGRTEVDAEKLGVSGISLGGITSALAAAVDPRINRAVLLLAGGGLDEILWTMDERDAEKYRKGWLASGKTRADLKELTKPLDPLTYADRLVGKKLLMMAGNIDEVVPPSAARALWEASGRPPIRWFDCGHYSAAGYMLPAIREAVAFFAAEVPRP